MGSMSDDELERRVERLEERVRELHLILREIGILFYFAVTWLVVPLLVEKWTGWHILSWWSIVALGLCSWSGTE
jgi:hypothetical protein